MDHARPRHAARRRRRDPRRTRPAARRARWSRSTATARCARWSAARTMSSSIYNRATQAVAPAGIGVQAVRLSRRARGRAQARRPGRRRAGDDQRLEPAQQFAAQSRARSRSAPPSPIRSTRSRRSWGRRSASAPSPTWRAASASPRRSTPIRRWCSARRDVRLIDMTRAFASVAQQGRRGHALWHHPRHREQRGDLPARGRHAAACWSRPMSPAQMTDLLQTAVNTGTAPRRADRPAGRGQDRHDHVEQGRLVPGLFERADHRRVDGPRRRAHRSPACRAAPRRRRPSPPSCARGRQAAGRAVRHPGDAARMAARTR